MITNQCFLWEGYSVVVLYPISGISRKLQQRLWSRLVEQTNWLLVLHKDELKSMFLVVYLLFRQYMSESHDKICHCCCHVMSGVSYRNLVVTKISLVFMSFICFDLQEGPHGTGYIICHYIQGLEYRPGEDFGDLLSNKVEMVEDQGSRRASWNVSHLQVFIEFYKAFYPREK